jgi:hypothetical protein
MDKPKIYVVIPWKHQDSRLRAYEMVKDWYAKNLPEATVVSLTYSEIDWLPSHTRNLGVRFAQGNGADIVILNDADTIPEGTDTLRKTIEAAMSDNFIHNPFFKSEKLNNLFSVLNTFLPGNELLLALLPFLLMHVQHRHCLCYVLILFLYIVETELLLSL